MTSKVPDDWMKTTLGETLILIRNGSSEKQVDKITNYPVSRIETISDWKIDFTKVGYVKFLDDLYKLKVGDVLISNINSVSHIGKVAIYDGGKPLYHGMNLLILRFKDSYNNKFLHYLLVLSKKWFEKMCCQAVNQASINQSTLVTLPLIIPKSLKEQKKITTILQTIDKTVDQTKNLIEKHKKIKQGLMHDLLTNDNWDKKRLYKTIGNDASLIVAGPFGSNLKVSDYIDEGIPLIRLQNVDTGHFVEKDMKYISEKKATELAYHSFQSGDIVLGKLGDPVGKTCIVPEKFKKGIVVADVVRIRVNEKVANKNYVMQVLNSHYCRKKLNNEIIGTTRPRVNLTQVRDLIIPSPDLSEQKRIGDILSTIDSFIDSETEKLNKLLMMKSGLMQDLLTGKVRVAI